MIVVGDAFDAAKRADVDAVMVLSSPFIGANTKLMADLASKHALPAVTLFSEFARNGGLVSYGPNILDIIAASAASLPRCFRGVSPRIYRLNCLPSSSWSST
jgi:putative ABC transport system substrate-binding protein